HHLPDAARNAFAATMGVREACTLLRRAGSLVRALDAALPVDFRREGDVPTGRLIADTARTYQKALDFAVENWVTGEAPFSSFRDGRGVRVNQHRFPHGQPPAAITEPL